MTDNDIIKALECCSYGSEFKCQECPANDCSLSCGSKLAKKSLDLINRQKAEIINRTEEYNDMLEQRNKVEEALEIKTMDVNSLTSERDALQEMVAEQKSEKERLEYVLMAVMHSVDKWLEGDELKQDEANRACTIVKHFVGLSDNVTYVVEDLNLGDNAVSKYRYTLNFNPAMWLPVEVQTID